MAGENEESIEPVEVVVEVPEPAPAPAQENGALLTMIAEHKALIDEAHALIEVLELEGGSQRELIVALQDDIRGLQENIQELEKEKEVMEAQPEVISEPETIAEPEMVEEPITEEILEPETPSEDKPSPKKKRYFV